MGLLSSGKQSPFEMFGRQLDPILVSFLPFFFLSWRFLAGRLPQIGTGRVGGGEVWTVEQAALRAPISFEVLMQDGDL